MISGKLVKIIISILVVVSIFSSCSTSKYCKEEVYNAKYFEAVVVVPPENDQEVGLLKITTKNSTDPISERVIMAIPCRFSSSFEEGKVVYIQLVKLDNMLFVEDIMDVKPNDDDDLFNSPTVDDLLEFKTGMFNLHKPFEKEGHDNTNHKLGHLNTKIRNYNQTGLDQYKGTLERDSAIFYSTLDLDEHMRQQNRYFELRRVSVDPNIFGTDEILIIVDVTNTHHHPH